ncbi:MAG: IS110 family transposase ISHvo9 [Candidatus Methanoperedenaceae archaeon GB50]|nr:MAG: IS110 family transposase ISHvo9 [Candidatus Methanoperedenaceae archaeon GB50]CAD7777546.1 MAG: IS110 family transposase ISHvo9 [Candidatus Methanoperedenaceae archaeon GB50]CAD7780106.1 MAG: IS110 family transposase ISHvo9 [Candidatus Methanoperedenaceae archaeon GB50]CAD7780320.1 MAG: IS110 family transposase ISHvo9 [Candidatus Methanoperedenaceae archaeon GB50]CAD7783013.1 MAG: IS110 family transposase ISHvo9 [Candidatus Methanoperedenaceae archaeon GB50]
MYYMGIDLHKKYFVSTIMDKEGKVLKRSRVSTDRESIKHYFSLLKDKGLIKAVMEATFNWVYFYDEISPFVDEAILAHPLKTRAIAEARIKTDSIDSNTLAHLLRSDLIPKAYTPGFETRDLRNLLRFRIALVKVRTSLKNRVHAVLDRNYVEDPIFKELSDKFGKKGMKIMRALKLKGNDTSILNGYLDLIEEITKKINDLEKRIKSFVKEDKITLLLKTIPGIGDIVAFLIRYEIDDIGRFSSTKKLCSYAGIVPSTYSSGGKTYHGRITKQGNKWLRWALAEASHKAIVKSPSLRRYYNKIKYKKGSNTATIALSRKLLEIVYKVWKEQRPYYEKEICF